MAITASRAFTPALNKEGLSKLTLTGFEHLKDVKVDEKTGKEKPWELFKICFVCKAKYRGMEPQKVSISTGVKYSQDNLLGKTLKALGIQIDEDLEMELDEDGFEAEAISETLDNDGFEDSDILLDIDVESLIKAKIGINYKAKISRSKKGFWGVDIDSLQIL